MIALLLTVVLLASAAQTPSNSGRVEITVDRTRVGMGRVVHVTARSRRADGKPGEGDEMLPYVNGKRWGSHEYADAEGRAAFMLPLPMVSAAEIRVQARRRTPAPEEYWIWNASQGQPGTIFLQRTFVTNAKPKGGTLWVAVDDAAAVYLNGMLVAQKTGWHDVKTVKIAGEKLRRGENWLSVEATNGSGPCGLIMRMTVETASGKSTIITNQDWHAFASKPAGWPLAVAPGGEPARLFGRADSGAVTPEPWPTIPISYQRTGVPLPRDAIVSKPVHITVEMRKLQRPPTDPNHLIAVQWEEWFTRLNCTWNTAHAVPLMGFYDSNMPAVARQHLIWFIESGVDCIVADWSNNIWNAKSWSEIGPGTMELHAASTLMMDEMAKMREEGHAVPKMTFLTGISYARPEGPNAVNGQLAFIWDNYVDNPKYKGLWLELGGKPLVLILDVGATYIKDKIVLDDRFAVRYVGAQQDVNKNNALGLWTWMDHAQPMPVMHEGKVEALTVCIGSFGPGGWLASDARGRRNGATIIEDWHAAMRLRPWMLQLHQFNEFAGQPEGSPAAPPNVYVDIYSPELSDDYEPTSLTAPAYRGTGGWGFLQFNLIRALVDLYRQPTPKTTVVTIASPLQRQVVENDALTVRWVSVGVPARSYTLVLNGKTVGSGLTGSSTKIDLHSVPNGTATLRIVAEGTIAHYALSWTEDSLPASRPMPASMEVPFVIRRAGK